MDQKAKIFPLGDSALTVCFGNIISEELNREVLKLAEYTEKNSFQGFIETVPAYSSLSIFYDTKFVRKHFTDFPTAFEAVRDFVEFALGELDDIPPKKPRRIEIPVSFDRRSALDLEFIARTNKLAAEDVLDIFLSKTYRVYMLGFLPGFVYMGEVDERIATPRKDNPRKTVPKGSVAIAGKQTGIYPLASPGGWQIIGQTEIELFTPEKKDPTFLKTGDLVKFCRQKGQ